MRSRSLFAVTVAVFLCSALPAKAQGEREKQAPLPDGDGKAIVQNRCTVCHGLDMLPNQAGAAADQWQKVFSTMVALPGDQPTVVSNYLAKSFPVRSKPEPVIVPGSATVSFKEWILPTLGQRPHDPLSTPDGNIWWTGMFANVVGRLDPRTGAMKEYPLKTPGTGPHGLVADKDGNIWYTGNQKALIGKLDPKTGAVTEYTMPDPKARGPHTPIFDQKGNFWFTLQSGHVGRIVPATGEVKLSATPTSGTYPYGIQVNSKGVPWYVDFRGNRLGSIDPVTMEIKEYTLPNPETRPRRIALTADDVVWYADYTRGYLGRYDPKTGQTREFASPSGSKSQPYGIAAIGNVIWYVESAVRPNTLVRFDIQTEKFQTWAIPAGGGVVRNMMATKDGNLVLAESALNRVALVEVGKGAGRTQQ
jgi:virginiamycin B lyase